MIMDRATGASTSTDEQIAGRYIVLTHWSIPAKKFRMNGDLSSVATNF